MRPIADFILAYPRFVLVSVILLSIAAIFPALRIDTDFNLEGFFPEDAPTIEEYQMLAEEFGRDDNVIAIAFESDSLFSPEVLGDISNLTASLEDITNITQVISITHTSRLFDDGGMLRSEPYFSSNTADSVTINALLADPFARGLLINEQGDVTAIYIELDENVNSYSVREQVIRDMNSALDKYRGTYDFKIAGIPYFRNQYVQMLNAEIIMYISISSVLIIALLWGLFRNIRGILIPISIVWLTILFTVAVIVLTGGYFEILSSSIAPILLCVGVADSIHLLTKYQDSRLNGMAPGLALRETIIILGGATLLTSITTAIGFATLSTSNVVPMQRFGIYTAAGVMIAFLITIFLLPTLMPYFKDPEQRKGKHTQVHEFLGRILERSYGFVLGNKGAIIIFTALITVIFAFGATNLKVNGKIFDDVGPDQEIMQHSRFFSERLTPQFPLEFVIDTGEQNGALHPEILHKIETLENHLLTYPEIARTTSLTTLVKQIHATMSPEDALTNPIPTDSDLISQYMFLLEISDADAASLLVDFDYQSIRLAANVQDAGSYRTNQIRDEIEPFIKDLFPNQTVYISGTSILVADLTDNIVQSLSWSIGLAFLFISLLMGWLFRDLKLVVISILPNVIPLIIVAGTMGFLGVDLKPSTAVIFTIAFGIAVDDSIHYLARLRIEIARCSSLSEAISITTQRTGRAIILTSIILLVGFGTLASSAFTSTMLMGALTSLTIVTALLADIFFLPALLHWVKPNFGHIISKD
ncbi:MAG: MMPL family transporter [Balneolales bacterium]|nr:MMPL family transporter [Balneolales bacterium]